MYEWIDPADAVFVVSAREALKIERQAWQSCHAERMKLLGDNTMMVVLYKITDGSTAAEEIVKFDMPAREFAKAASGLIQYRAEHYSFLRLQGNVAFFLLSNGIVMAEDFLGK